MKYIIIYAVESSICLIVFMTFYKMLLQRDTRHSRNRIFLIVTSLISLVLPLLDVKILPDGESSLVKSIIWINLPEINVSGSSPAESLVQGINILGIVYVTGLVIAFISFLISAAGILILIVANRSEGRVIRISGNRHSCFSAFGYVFISRSVDAGDADKMIAHELNHIRRHHFVDLLLTSFVGMLQWFNPGVYFLRRSLQAVHEFEADEACLSSGEDIISYQSLLVSSAFNTNIPILTNKFSNKSLLKKRIIMMTKKKSRRFSSVKILLAAPLAAIMFLAFSCNKGGEKQVSAAPVKQAEAASKDEIFTVCDQMPEFPGGDAALIGFISKNLRYPDAAKEKSLQGKVLVQFCITKEGKITDSHIVRGVDPLLDNEALRVVNMLPQFKPGSQNGKAVSVWYTLPITYALK